MTHFNEIANSWDSIDKLEQNKLYADKIKEVLNKTSFNSILEFGCGTGLLGANFIEEQNHFLGVDTSLGMLKVFNSKFSQFKNVKSINLNLEENSLENSVSKFDLIITSMAFHHLKYPQGMLEKFSHMLMPKGAIAIIDLDKENGTFHPDPKNMGVYHFGFLENETQEWAKKLNFKNYSRVIINSIKKESGNFPIFLAVYNN